MRLRRKKHKKYPDSLNEIEAEEHYKKFLEGIPELHGALK